MEGESHFGAASSDCHLSTQLLWKWHSSSQPPSLQDQVVPPSPLPHPHFYREAPISLEVMLAHPMALCLAGQWLSYPAVSKLEPSRGVLTSCITSALSCFTAYILHCTTSAAGDGDIKSPRATASSPNTLPGRLEYSPGQQQPWPLQDAQPHAASRGAISFPPSSGSAREEKPSKHPRLLSCLGKNNSSVAEQSQWEWCQGHPH